MQLEGEYQHNSVEVLVAVARPSARITGASNGESCTCLQPSHLAPPTQDEAPATSATPPASHLPQQFHCHRRVLSTTRVSARTVRTDCKVAGVGGESQVAPSQTRSPHTCHRIATSSKQAAASIAAACASLYPIPNVISHASQLTRDVDCRLGDVARWDCGQWPVRERVGGWKGSNATVVVFAFILRSSCLPLEWGEWRGEERASRWVSSGGDVAYIPTISGHCTILWDGRDDVRDIDHGLESSRPDPISQSHALPKVDQQMLLLIPASHRHHHHHHHLPSLSTTLPQDSARRVPLASRMWAGAFRPQLRHLRLPPHHPRLRLHHAHPRPHAGTSTNAPSIATSTVTAAPRVPTQAPGTTTYAHPSTVRDAGDRRRILEPGNFASRLHHPLPLPLSTPTSNLGSAGTGCRHAYVAGTALATSASKTRVKMVWATRGRGSRVTKRAAITRVG
ncbi:hypothetical protein GALMADRAFT_148252 [Galerina marginata CBS 339.88]|uniref:Uncharacterized protein n=1 Tax=Galerina marginata (strain CBS 339.88) TaxID=685588 RepID=A0A067SGW2_GALM3|nr:hypothetical protein GALMADRAFT_148252 [Galerina marginata CBS 339.88]